MFAAAIRDRLARSGVRSWIAADDVPRGASWLDSMLEAVVKAEVLILVYSAHALTSPWVRSELTAAFDRNLPIVTFRVHDAPFPDQFRYTAALRQIVDALQPPIGPALDELMDAVQRIRSERSARPEPSVWGDGASSGTLASRKAAALDLVLDGQMAVAEAELRSYLTLSPRDPMIRLGLAVAIPNGIRLDRITYQSAAEMHHHLGVPLAEPALRGCAALALLALHQDFARQAGVLLPPPERGALVTMAKSNAFDPTALQLVRALPLCGSTREALGL